MIKAVCLSDTHGSHLGVKIPDADWLIHAGDFSSRGGMKDTVDFLNWFNIHPHKRKIFIAGNHDWLPEKDPGLFQTLLKQYPDLTYLQDTSVVLDGLKVHGSPISPTFYNWAFNRDRGPQIKRHWDMIPDDTDILITHGPAYGYCDIAPNGGPVGITERVGCKHLLDAIKRVKPRIHLSGHIHYSYGVGTINHDDGSKTMCYNSSVLNEDYIISNKPWIINF